MILWLPVALAQRVLLSYGSFEGVTTGNVTKFLGIPFAAPPIGPLRFKPPQKPLHRHMMRADKLGPACVQPCRKGDYCPPVSEDCLTINIYKSAQAKDKLPVIAFIYGGAFTSGSSALPLYNGGNIVDAFEDVIVVTFNYRLGVFGFLASAELANEKSLNLGLRDQIAAFEWLKEHISRFGGDPNRITAMGQSAGASKVFLTKYLLVPT